MPIGELFLWWLPAVACAIAVIHDLQKREIPDWLPIILAILLPVRLLINEGAFPWWHYVIGGVVALLIGLMVGRGDRFGGGDIKLFAALGLWFGIYAVFPLALWIAIAGLPLAIIAALRTQNDLAYAPAIFIGVCVHCLSPDLVQRMML